jgi:ribosomal protein S18 acetylase RimI-like enzyme
MAVHQMIVETNQYCKTNFQIIMRYLELCTLTESQIDDLLGLMKELNADLTVTPLQQQRSVAAPGTRIFIAENDEKHIVGCATLCVFESPTGRKASVEDVVVLPAYRGQGIGRTLLQRIIDFAKNKLAPIDLRLTSNPTRTEANALYQALGFVQRETNVYKMSL